MGSPTTSKIPDVRLANLKVTQIAVQFTTAYASLRIHCWNRQYGREAFAEESTRRLLTNHDVRRLDRNSDGIINLDPHALD